MECPFAQSLWEVGCLLTRSRSPLVNFGANHLCAGGGVCISRLGGKRRCVAFASHYMVLSIDTYHFLWEVLLSYLAVYVLFSLPL